MTHTYIPHPAHPQYCDRCGYSRNTPVHVADTFVVMDCDHHDAIVCGDRESVFAAIDMLMHPVTILRITEGELCRDVTEEFLPADEPVREDAASRADRFHQAMMEEVE